MDLSNQVVFEVCESLLQARVEGLVDGGANGLRDLVRGDGGAGRGDDWLVAANRGAQGLGGFGRGVDDDELGELRDVVNLRGVFELVCFEGVDEKEQALCLVDVVEVGVVLGLGEARGAAGEGTDAAADGVGEDLGEVIAVGTYTTPIYSGVGLATADDATLSADGQYYTLANGEGFVTAENATLAAIGTYTSYLITATAGIYIVTLPERSTTVTLRPRALEVTLPERAH